MVCPSPQAMSITVSPARLCRGKKHSRTQWVIKVIDQQQTYNDMTCCIHRRESGRFLRRLCVKGDKYHTRYEGNGQWRGVRCVEELVQGLRSVRTCPTIRHRNSPKCKRVLTPCMQHCECHRMRCHTPSCLCERRTANQRHNNANHLLTAYLRE